MYRKVSYKQRTFKNGVRMSVARVFMYSRAMPYHVRGGVAIVSTDWYGHEEVLNTWH